MTKPFCVCPENADLIAENLAAGAKEAASELAYKIARLHVGRGQYRLACMSQEELRSVRRLLTEIGAEIDDILAHVAPAEPAVPVLQAAE